MEGKNQNKQLIFHLYLSFCIGVFITFSSYFHLPLSYFGDYFAYGIHFLILQFTVFGFVYFLTLNKYVFNTLFSLFFIVLALFSYWIYSLDITISESVIHAALETKPDIAVDLLTLPFVVYIVIVLLILFSVLKFYKKVCANRFNWRFFCAALLAVGVYYFVENMRFGTLNRRMPYVFSMELKRYFDKPGISLSALNSEEIIAIKDVEVVFVLGESVRADHLGINGYIRNTTPRLSKRKNVISFPYIRTPLTYTAASLPQILTNISVDSKKNGGNVFSIYSFLNKVGKNTIWIGNQTPETSYKEYINQNDEIEIIDPFHSVLSFHKKYDEELLKSFEEKYKIDSNNFYTIHMIGSHWWYEDRYPSDFQKFRPVVKSKHISSNSKEEMINSYDNTVVYLDWFLNEVITTIEKSGRKTLMIYLSDHGEVLGEKGKWLHAQEDEASKNPAMLIWYSDEFKEAFPNKIINAKNNSVEYSSTDILFYSVLNAIEVKGYDFVNENNVFGQYSKEKTE